MEESQETQASLPDLDMANVLRQSVRCMSHVLVYGAFAIAFCLVPSYLAAWSFGAFFERAADELTLYGMRSVVEWAPSFSLVVEAFALLACAVVAAAALQWRRTGEVAILACILTALKRWPLILVNAAIINIALFFISRLMLWPRNIWLFLIVNVACIVLMCMLVAAFILFIQVIVEERGGPVAGLTRSRFLTRGYAGQAFLLSLVMIVAAGALCFLVYAIGQASYHRSLFFEDFSLGAVILSGIFHWHRGFWFMLWCGLGAVFWTVSMTMLYCRLRELKEGWNPRS